MFRINHIWLHLQNFPLFDKPKINFTKKNLYLYYIQKKHVLLLIITDAEAKTMSPEDIEVPTMVSAEAKG